MTFNITSNTAPQQVINMSPDTVTSHMGSNVAAAVEVKQVLLQVLFATGAMSLTCRIYVATYSTHCIARLLRSHVISSEL